MAENELTRTEEQKESAKDLVRRVFEDGTAEINGRDYTFTKMRHKARRSVFAFYTTVANEVNSGSLGFLDSPRFEVIEGVINDHVLFDNELLSKRPDHWDQYPSDYVKFISIALAVISYPFTEGSAGDSQ